jgi:hypothetical protein
LNSGIHEGELETGYSLAEYRTHIPHLGYWLPSGTLLPITGLPCYHCSGVISIVDCIGMRFLFIYTAIGFVPLAISGHPIPAFMRDTDLNSGLSVPTVKWGIYLDPSLWVDDVHKHIMGMSPAQMDSSGLMVGSIDEDVLMWFYDIRDIALNHHRPIHPSPAGTKQIDRTGDPVKTFDRLWRAIETSPTIEHALYYLDEMSALAKVLLESPIYVVSTDGKYGPYPHPDTWLSSLVDIRTTLEGSELTAEVLGKISRSLSYLPYKALGHSSPPPAVDNQLSYSELSDPIERMIALIRSVQEDRSIEGKLRTLEIIGQVAKDLSADY